MSYSVWVEAEMKHAGWIQLGDSYNITGNLAQMFVALTDGTPKDWAGTLAGEMIPKLEQGVNKLMFYPDRYKQFEAPNGWGTVPNCQRFLMEVLGLCREYPFATLKVGRKYGR